MGSLFRLPFVHDFREMPARGSAPDENWRDRSHPNLLGGNFENFRLARPGDAR